MSNNSNPYSLDGEQVRGKGLDNNVVRATVIDVLTETHAVRVNPRGDNAPVVAPVVSLPYGSSTVPTEGERVLLLYVEENTPVCLGSIYLLDGKAPPDLSEEEVQLGNANGSYVRLADTGAINIITDGNAPVDIDVQSASVEKTQSQTISGDETWEKIVWDQIEDDNDNLWQPTDNSILARHGGLYQIDASVSFPNPKQNNKYSIGIFINGKLEQRFTKQSANNVEMSLSVSTNELLSNGDVIDIRARQDSGSGKDILGSSVTDEFCVNRTGRRRGGDVQ